MAADLPDVFLWSVFRRLSANDRLSASQVCPNWFHRVREVNQTVRFLTIIVSREAFDKEKIFEHDYFIFGEFPFVKQLLMEEEVDSKELEISSEWNTLHFSTNETSTGLKLNSATVQQIINAFPATTQLNFINTLCEFFQHELLIQMLETGDQDNNIKGWRQQLTTLRLLDKTEILTPADINSRLFTAINSLPALERLVISIDNPEAFQLPDLPVFSRLKEIRFNQNSLKDFVTFLHSVSPYAAVNADLRIDLHNAFWSLKSLLNNSNSNFTLPDQQFREKIVRLNSENPYYSSELELICTHFPRLTSLSITDDYGDNSRFIFDILSKHLFHLRHLFISFQLYCRDTEYPHDVEYEILTALHDGQNMMPDPAPAAPLPSVKVLQLSVWLISHFDLNKLPLSGTLPNLKAIHFDYYCCKYCNFISPTYLTVEPDEPLKKCLSAVLPQLSLRTSVPLEQITFKINEGRNTISADKLLALL